MQNAITRALARWGATRAQRGEAARLAALPQYLLRDMGLPLEGEAAIASHLRTGRR